MKNVGETIKTSVSLTPRRLSTTDTALAGTAIDRTGFQHAVFVLDTGTLGGTSPTLVLDAKLQESSTSGGTYTDVSGATFTQVIAGSTHREMNVDVSSLKAWVRLMFSATLGGTSPTIDLSAVGVLGNYNGLLPI